MKTYTQAELIKIMKRTSDDMVNLSIEKMNQEGGDRLIEEIKVSSEIDGILRLAANIFGESPEWKSLFDYTFGLQDKLNNSETYHKLIKFVKDRFEAYRTYIKAGNDKETLVNKFYNIIHILTFFSDEVLSSKEADRFQAYVDNLKKSLEETEVLK